jgi:hypothetical protein
MWRQALIFLCHDYRIYCSLNGLPLFRDLEKAHWQSKIRRMKSWSCKQRREARALIEAGFEHMTSENNDRGKIFKKLKTDNYAEAGSP